MVMSSIGGRVVAAAAARQTRRTDTLIIMFDVDFGGNARVFIPVRVEC